MLNSYYFADDHFFHVFEFVEEGSPLVLVDGSWELGRDIANDELVVEEAKRIQLYELLELWVEVFPIGLS